MLRKAGFLEDKFGEKIPHRAGHGNKYVSYTEEDENYLYGEDNTGKQEEICEQENDAGADALVALVEKE